MEEGCIWVGLEFEFEFELELELANELELEVVGELLCCAARSAQVNTI